MQLVIPLERIINSQVFVSCLRKNNWEDPCYHSKKKFTYNIGLLVILLLNKFQSLHGVSRDCCIKDFVGTFNCSHILNVRTSFNRVRFFLSSWTVNITLFWINVVLRLPVLPEVVEKLYCLIYLSNIFPFLTDCLKIWNSFHRNSIFNITLSVFYFSRSLS